MPEERVARAAAEWSAAIEALARAQETYARDPKPHVHAHLVAAAERESAARERLHEAARIAKLATLAEASGAG